MNRKIKEKIESWDLKSFFLTVVIISSFIFLFFYFTDITDRLRENAKEGYKGETRAQIISVEPMEGITHSKWKGTKIFIEGYKIVYSYEVNGQAFKKTDIITLKPKNKRFLTTVLERKSGDTFLIKFDLNDPARSILVEERTPR